MPKKTFTSKVSTTVKALKNKIWMVPAKPHHEGKGTKARLNTAAEKHFFGGKK